MEEPTPPPKYEFPPMLASLVRDCEKACVSGCCGISAYDFSPLYVAASISTYTGHVSESDIARLEEDLVAVENAARGMEENEDGFVCCNEAMNHYFTRKELLEMVTKIRHTIAAAPAMLERSAELAWKRPEEPIPKEHTDRPFNGKLAGSWRVVRTTPRYRFPSPRSRTIIHFLINGRIRYESDDASGGRVIYGRTYQLTGPFLKIDGEKRLLEQEEDGSVAMTNHSGTCWLVRLSEPEPYSRWFVDEAGAMRQIPVDNG